MSTAALSTRPDTVAPRCPGSLPAWLVMIAVGLGSNPLRALPATLLRGTTVRARGEVLIREAGLAAATVVYAATHAAIGPLA